RNSYKSERSCLSRGYFWHIELTITNEPTLTLRDDIYRFFDSTIKNIYKSDTSSIKLKNLNGYLDS
ncbi:hypothetical protein, partial [Borreliella bavariensis]|uniref:hypothetical protein n=1 Tax=Borreliella bavariensis TaxID=664662 RepID=UPI001C002C2C